MAFSTCSTFTLFLALFRSSGPHRLCACPDLRAFHVWLRNVRTDASSASMEVICIQSRCGFLTSGLESPTLTSFEGFPLCTAYLGDPAASASPLSQSSAFHLICDTLDLPTKKREGAYCCRHVVLQERDLYTFLSSQIWDLEVATIVFLISFNGYTTSESAWRMI